MSLLADCWPRLAAIPHLSLTSLPTSVHGLDSASRKVGTAVWVKRDDLTARPYGGNKVRKLEFLLADALHKGADTLVTAGAVGSHHVFATTLYGAMQGLKTHAVLMPQPYHPHVEEQLRADLAERAELYPAQNYRELVAQLAKLVVRLRREGHRPYLVPPGGSTNVGTLGYVQAGLELAQQIDRGECADLDAVYVACGTGATVAGIALGLAIGGAVPQVIGVRVTDRVLANRPRIKRLIKGADALLRNLEPRVPDMTAEAIRMLRLDHIEFGRGYGYPTPSADAAEVLGEQDGLRLDPTYTAKAFAALLRDAEGEQYRRKLLLWHTLSSAPMDAVLEKAPTPPPRLSELMLRA